MPSIEFEAATIQLEALGFVNLMEDGGYMRLTDKGIKRAEKIMGGPSTDDRLLVLLHCADFAREHDDFSQEIGDRQ